MFDKFGKDFTVINKKSDKKASFEIPLSRSRIKFVNGKLIKC